MPTTQLCDTERCTTCHADTVAGIDQNSQCDTCAGRTSFDHLLRLMSNGITRDRRSGRFASTRKA